MGPVDPRLAAAVGPSLTCACLTRKGTHVGPCVRACVCVEGGGVVTRALSAFETPQLNNLHCAYPAHWDKQEAPCAKVHHAASSNACGLHRGAPGHGSPMELEKLHTYCMHNVV